MTSQTLGERTEGGSGGKRNLLLWLYIFKNFCDEGVQRRSYPMLSK